MSALTKSIIRKSRDRGPLRFKVKNATQIYAGAFVGIEWGSSARELIPLDNTSSMYFVGVAQEEVLGDGTKDCLVSTESFDLEQVSVTGASATSVGEFVYATTDNDLTLTRPSSKAIPIGRVIKYHSGSECDVRIFGMEEYSKLVGKGIKKLFLGSLYLPSSAGDVVSELPLTGRGKITNFYIQMGADAAGTTPNVTFSLEFGPSASRTAVTGGSINMTETGATAQGTLKTATPTANNEFDDGDVLSVKSTVTAAYTGGYVNAWIDILELP